MAKNVTVILIDDNRDVRAAVRNVLKESHFTLLFATSHLDDAETKLRRLKVPPDVALIDRSFFEARGDLETSSRAGFFFDAAVSERFPDTIRVFFSDFDGVQEFGTARFPGENRYKTPGVIEKNLIRFIDSLSLAARR